MTASTSNTAQPKFALRWFSFSLRTLLIVVTLVGCGLSWLGLKVREARRQAAAVAAIEKLGGWVRYDYEFDSQGNLKRNAVTPGPAWLQSLVGDDFFRSVEAVDLSRHFLKDDYLKHVQGLTRLKELNLDDTHITDAGLERLKGLTLLETLCLCGTQVTDVGLKQLTGLMQLKSLYLNRTNVTDSGLDHLKRITQLRVVGLVRTQVTDEGVAKLHAALPNCQIDRSEF